MHKTKKLCGVATNEQAFCVQLRSKQETSLLAIEPPLSPSLSHLDAVQLFPHCSHLFITHPGNLRHLDVEVLAEGTVTHLHQYTRQEKGVLGLLEHKIYCLCHSRHLDVGSLERGAF